MAFAAYVPARASRGAVFAHRKSFAPPLCTEPQDRCARLSISISKDLNDPVIGGVRLASVKSRISASFSIFLTIFYCTYFTN